LYKLNKVKVNKKKIISNKIYLINFEYNFKNYKVENLNNKNLKKTFNFFLNFNKIEKLYFGYPLFQPIDLKYSIFKKKYNKYLEEKNCWNFFLITYRNKLIGLSYIKKIGFLNKKGEKNKSPTLGGPFVLKKFRKKNIGNILVNLCAYQAKLKKCKFLYARIMSENIAALTNAKKIGFVKTGRSFKLANNKKDLELKLKITYNS
tara:strand:+ start:504 stop:1115 length:612 start_codon:yes stop_codon:yes gene_type:complete